MISGLNDPNQDWNTRVSWKYSCSRAITGTPQFLINGVFINASPSWSLSDWQSILDPLLTPFDDSAFVEKSSTAATCPAGQVSCEYLPGTSQCCLAGENCIKNVGCRC